MEADRFAVEASRKVGDSDESVNGHLPDTPDAPDTPRTTVADAVRAIPEVGRAKSQDQAAPEALENTPS